MLHPLSLRERVASRKRSRVRGLCPRAPLLVGGGIGDGLSRHVLVPVVPLPARIVQKVTTAQHCSWQGRKALRPCACPPVSYAGACCPPSAGGGSATGSAGASTGSEETAVFCSGVASTAGLGVGSGVGSALGMV